MWKVEVSRGRLGTDALQLPEFEELLVPISVLFETVCQPNALPSNSLSIVTFSSRTMNQEFYSIGKIGRTEVLSSACDWLVVHYYYELWKVMTCKEQNLWTAFPIEYVMIEDDDLKNELKSTDLLYFVSFGQWNETDGYKPGAW